MARGAAVAVADFQDFLTERSIPSLVDKVVDDPMFGFFVGWMRIIIRWPILSSWGWKKR